MRRTLLPYQERWVADSAGLKVIEKARRIGLSWAEAYDAVLHAGVEDGGNVYYQSYSKEMTRSFIDDCAEWAADLQLGAEAVGETLIRDGDRDVQAFRIGLDSGKEIVAMTSAPRAFRSKGRPGDLGIVDEAAFVDDLAEVLKAALAFRVWGGRLHVMSTHNGEANPFASLVRDVREGVQPGSIHRVTFSEAIGDGLYRRICQVTGESWTPEAEAAWEVDIRAEYGAHAGEELDCTPASGTGAWLSWALIRAAEDAAAGDPAGYAGGPVYIGNDIARRHDLWVAVVMELVGDVLWVRELIVRQGIPFREQREIISELNSRYRPVRIAVDQTGMGEAQVELLKDDLGELLVEGVLLTAPRRLSLATAWREALEDGRARIPTDADLRRDLHAIRTEIGPTGNPRLLADRGDTDGHADRFWACCLAAAAAASSAGPIMGLSVGERASAGFADAPSRGMGESAGLIDRAGGIIHSVTSRMGGFG